MTAENPIEEVWRIRDKISAECGHDIKRLAARMKRLEPEYADRLARLPIRRRPHLIQIESTW